MIMDTHSTFDGMWVDAIKRIVMNGRKLDSRNGGSTEILGYSAKLSSTEEALLVHPTRKLSPVYASAELLWYLARSDSGEMIQRYAPSYGKFLDKDGTAFGAYGKRLRLSNSGDQLDIVVEQLKHNSRSRQSVIALWQPNDLLVAAGGECPDIPCTLTLQFLAREGRVHLVVNMRSNDVWLGMPYDVYCFTSIQRLVAAKAGLEPGTYTHNVGSLHIYDKHMTRCIDACAPYRKLEHRISRDFGEGSGVFAAIGLEEEARANRDLDLEMVQFLRQVSPALADTVALCEWHCNLGHVTDKNVSESLKEILA